MGKNGIQTSLFKKNTYSFTLDNEIVNELDIICKNLGLKRSALVNDILKDSLSSFGSMLDGGTYTVIGTMSKLVQKIEELEGINAKK